MTSLPLCSHSYSLLVNLTILSCDTFSCVHSADGISLPPTYSFYFIILFGSFSSVETGIHRVKGTHLIYSHEVIQRFSHISFNSLKTSKSPPHDVIHSQRFEFFICHLTSDLLGGFSDKVIS